MGIDITTIKLVDSIQIRKDDDLYNSLSVGPSVTVENEVERMERVKLFDCRQAWLVNDTEESKAKSISLVLCSQLRRPFNPTTATKAVSSNTPSLNESAHWVSPSSYHLPASTTVWHSSGKVSARSRQSELN